MGYPPLGSAPPDRNDADVGNLLVDEVGDADPRRQLILEQLDARHDLAPRPRRSVRHPGEQFVGKSGAIRGREPVEIRLGRVRQEDPPGHAERRCERWRYSPSASLSEKPRSEPSAIWARAASTAATTASSPTSTRHSSSSGVWLELSSDMATRVDQPPATKATTT